MSFGMVERTEAILTIALLLVSAALAVIGSLTAPQISDALEDGELRVTLGIVIFLIAQFLVFTPSRMWRDAVWVTNIEARLDEMWEFHGEGVDLLNAHVEFTEAPRNDKATPDEAVNEWVTKWIS